MTAELTGAFAAPPWQGDATAMWDSAHGELRVRLRDPHRRDEALQTISARSGGALTVQPCPPDDDEAPIINGPIKGGSMIIAIGGDDAARASAEAADLAAVLRGGALRAPLVLDRKGEAAAQPAPGPGPAAWILVGVGAALLVAFAVWIRSRRRA